MKNMKLTVLVTSVMLLVSGMAVAKDTYKHNIHNNFSKRPYHAPLQDKAYTADDQWQGATLVSPKNPEDEAAVSKQKRKLQEFRLHSLGKRPFME